MFLAWGRRGRRRGGWSEQQGSRGRGGGRRRREEIRVCSPHSSWGMKRSVLLMKQDFRFVQLQLLALLPQPHLLSILALYALWKGRGNVTIRRGAAEAMMMMILLSSLSPP